MLTKNHLTEQEIRRYHDLIISNYFSQNHMYASCEEKGISERAIDNFLVKLRSALNATAKQIFYTDHVKKYLESNISIRRYCEINEISLNHLMTSKSGYTYKEILENMEGIHPQFFDIIKAREKGAPRKRLIMKKKPLSDEIDIIDIKNDKRSLKVIKYHELLKEFHGFNGSLEAFARLKKETINAIRSYKSAFSFHLINREVFEEYSSHIQKIGDETIRSYVIKNNLNLNALNRCLKNIRYRKIIEQYEKKGKDEMNFIPVRQEEEKKINANTIAKEKVNYENNLELTVSDDIKVSISKHLPMEKLIKIIEFFRGI